VGCSEREARLLSNIEDVKDLSGENSPTDECFGIRRHRTDFIQGIKRGFIEVMVGRYTDHIAVKAKYCAICCST